ncbi:MAG: endo-1,4-beta-xylanase [Clostridiales bacterium]|nr:endo-1,4-beta-xylanase [Clostridiales bacterium]MBQ6270141.1 endo-1,4-beta-xylanase [Clostridiales bacterium]MCR5059061.1 endo-1,4-beta-xylanase [Clostridiales bacterium]
MLKKKIGAMFLALAMLSSIALTACNSSDKGESESAASEVATESATETETETEPTSTESAVPSIMEDFGGDAITYEPRGEVQLDVEDADGADGKVLHVSNRTENWNGVNFPCDNMAGNTINIKTSVKSPSDHVIISLQFDMLGSTKYENVIHISGCKDSFAVGEGTTPIPETATNVYVYVENSTTDDIYIDYMYVTIEGDYFDPANAADVELVDISSYESLKDLYKDDFYIGCCVPDSFVTSPVEEPRTLLLNQFNSITCENEMKPENVLDAATTLADPEKYNESPALDFTKAITILDFAKENNLKMRGHTLVWHSQTPDWFFYENYDTSANLASRELMLKRLENYIKGVFEFVNTNYPGMFYAFDVANECVDDSNNLRESNWTKTIGPDFLEYAFKYARQYAGDDIKLFYNDYNEYDSGKQDKIIEVLKPIAEAGNLDGMGLQSHISSPVSMERYIGALKKYADELGVTIHVTELDVNAVKSSANQDYEQGLYFQNLFSELLKAKAEGYDIESVTIWGLTDAGSWRSSDTPVLFRGDLSKKPAFDGVVLAKKGGELEKPSDYVEPPKDDDPFDDNFEDGTFAGSARAGATVKVVDGAYEGDKCVLVSGATETWDGYVVNLSRFLGKKLKVSFAVKSTAAQVSFSADIADLWPHIIEVDTTSGDWVFVEGELDLTTNKWVLPTGEVEVPADLDSLVLYWETQDCTDDLYIDAVHMEVVG